MLQPTLPVLNTVRLLVVFSFSSSLLENGFYHKRQMPVCHINSSENRAQKRNPSRARRSGLSASGRHNDTAFAISLIFVVKDSITTGPLYSASSSASLDLLPIEVILSRSAAVVGTGMKIEYPALSRSNSIGYRLFLYVHVECIQQKTNIVISDKVEEMQTLFNSIYEISFKAVPVARSPALLPCSRHIQQGASCFRQHDLSGAAFLPVSKTASFPRQHTSGRHI